MRQRKDRVDDTQPQVVKELRQMGYSVQPGMEDILVGSKNVTLWVELKTMDVFLKCGGLKTGTLKPSQIELLKAWKGSYMVAFTTEQIHNYMQHLIKQRVK